MVMVLLLSPTIVLLSFIIVVQKAYTSTSNHVIRCGRQMIKDTRKAKVVGGHDTYEGEFPWIVSIRKNGNHHCGGIIIGQRWVLTAAHCVHNEANDDLMVRVGEYDLYKFETQTKDYPVGRKYVHDNYSRINSLRNLSVYINNADIALLRTGNDIHLNEYAWPICFPPTTSTSTTTSTASAAATTPAHTLHQSANDVQATATTATTSTTNRINNKNSTNRMTAIVVGWGKINEKSTAHSDILQKAELEIIEQSECREWFRLTGRNFEIKNNILCAGYKNGGIDACHGDSGGPLLIKLQNGCARPLLPGIYSNVSVYTDWIHKIINQSYT